MDEQQRRELFDALEQRLEQRFDQRFAQIEQRFDGLEQHLDERFARARAEAGADTAQAISEAITAQTRTLLLGLFAVVAALGGLAIGVAGLT